MKYFLRLFVAICTIVLIPSISSADTDLGYDEKNVTNKGAGEFPKKTRPQWSNNETGIFWKGFRIHLDVHPLVNEYEKCDERQDSPWYYDDDRDSAVEYLSSHPSTKCQNGSVKSEQYTTKISETETVECNCKRMKVNVKDEDGNRNEYETVCQQCPKEIPVYKYKAHYTWLGKTGQLTILNGNLNSTAYQLYNACGYLNPESGKELTRTIEYNYRFAWDEIPPICIPATTTTMSERFDSRENISENEMKTLINESLAGGGASIVFADNKSDWNGEWTNRNLQFRRKCFDAHSGCKGDTGRKGVLEPELLRNRQKTLEMRTHPSPYEDKVNNVQDNLICETKFRQIKSLTKSCNSIVTDKGEQVEGSQKCFYSQQDDYKSTSEYPIIDKHPPTIKVTVADSEDNMATDSVRGDKWSFYAGQIAFNIDVRDPVGSDRIGFGISGLSAVSFDIFDESGNLVPGTNLSENIAYNAARTNSESMDKVPDIWNIQKAKFPILKAGKYTLKIGAIDHTQEKQSAIYVKDFMVVENYSKILNVPYKVDRKDKVERCHNQRNAAQLPEGCDASTGHIVIEDKTTNVLYADAKSSRDLIMTWYDKYYNLLNARYIKDIELEDGKTIYLDQIANIGDALVHKFDPAGNISNSIGMTNPLGKISIKTHSFAPGKFNPNYKGNLCFWNNFGENDCSNSWVKKYLIDVGHNGQYDYFYHIFTSVIAIGDNSDPRINLGVKNDIALKYETELESLRKRDEEARKKEADFLRQQQDFENLKKNIEIEKEKAKLEERKRLEAELSDQAQKKVEIELEKERLEAEKKLKAKDEQIAQMQRSIEDAKRKGQQGSMQIQGELQEDALKEMLISNFPFDSIVDVEKGIKGADLIQTVRSEFGQNIGNIAWESKNTKSWSDSWIEKLKEDRLRVGAGVAIIVSNTLPESIKNFGIYKDIWVSNYESALALAGILRIHMTEIVKTQNSLKGKDEKMEFLYNYLISPEFKAKIENILEAFSTMKNDLDREKRAMDKIWSAREKQLTRVIENTARLYGDMQGLIGSQLPTVEYLELESGQQDLDAIASEIQ